MIGKSVYVLVVVFAIVVLVGTAATRALAHEGVRAVDAAVTWFQTVTAK
jgi:hypothetical protein